MNYTGGPSISGCRPVLSLYPTHCFCQYLLLIFITFTNSSLFTRAFSTNSRRALRQRLSLWERSSTSPSRLTPCHLPGSTSPSLLRNATSPTEGRPWHSGKLLLFARGSPTRGNGDDRRQWRKQGGAVGAAASKTQAERGGCWEPQPGLGERSETERLYEGEPFLCRKVRLLAFSVSFWRKEWYNGFAVHPAYLTGEEVDALAYFLTFLVSVGADVVSHFICKWLDRYEENRKA